MQDYDDARAATRAAQSEVNSVASELLYQQNEKGSSNFYEYLRIRNLCMASGSPADAQLDCGDNAYNDYLDAETERSNTIDRLQSDLAIAEDRLSAAQSYESEVEADLKQQGLL